MDSILFIAVGGALGAFCRYVTGLLSALLFGKSFPVGTLVVNVAGSFLIGATAAALAANRLSSGPWNDLIMQGFCGALTTFSTFSMDSFRLFYQGRVWSASVNVVLSMILCLGAAALGLSLFPQA